MAKGGFFNVLQAALSGVAGGAQGYSEYEAEQNRRQRQAQSELLSALAAGYEPPEGTAQEIQIGGKTLKLNETPAARARREASERSALEGRRLDIQEKELGQRAEEGRLGREATLKAAGITAGAAGQRDAAEREAKTDERSKMGLSWYTQMMRDPAVPQQTKNAFGVAMSEAQARAGRTLTSREMGAIGADLMEIGSGERKLRSQEATSMADGGYPYGGAPPAGAAGAAGGPQVGGAPVEEDRIRDWMRKNPQRPDESGTEYKSRLQAAFPGVR
jgi:hypothetical protein